MKKINPSAYKPNQIRPTTATKEETSDEKFTKSELPGTGDHAIVSLSFMGMMVSAIALALSKKNKEEK